jgi:hypothetical protein
MHTHTYQGQTLKHDHPGGEYEHGYFEHPEDGFPYPVNSTPLADALAEVDKAAADGFAPDGTMRRHYRLALADLADAVRAHLGNHPEHAVPGPAGPPRRPMGWLAEELAEGTAPVVVPAHKYGARSENTRYRELVFIPGHDGEPARLVVTNLKSGHSEAYDLPEGVRLIAEVTS